MWTVLDTVVEGEDDVVVLLHGLELGCHFDAGFLDELGVAKEMDEDVGLSLDVGVHEFKELFVFFEEVVGEGGLVDVVVVNGDGVDAKGFVISNVVQLKDVVSMEDIGCAVEQQMEIRLGVDGDVGHAFLLKIQIKYIVKG